MAILSYCIELSEDWAERLDGNVQSSGICAVIQRKLLHQDLTRSVPLGGDHCTSGRCRINDVLGNSIPCLDRVSVRQDCRIA